MPNEVQGFLANLSLDGTDITNTVVSTPLSRARTALNKGVMDNTPDVVMIRGASSGTLNVTGQLSQAEHNSLEVTWAKDGVVPFVLTVAEGLGTDSSWAGDVALTSLDVEPQGEGLWEFTLSGETSGPVVFTPSIP